MIPDTHLLKLLFPTRYTSRSIRLVLWRALVYHRNMNRGALKFMESFFEYR